jgi:hypothetical protein
MGVPPGQRLGPPPHLSGPPQAPPQGPPEGWEQRKPGLAPPAKGFLGSLLDVNFDHMVTPKLIKLFYGVSLLLISLQCLTFFGIGLWIFSLQDWWAWGLIMAVAAPLVWVFELLLVRIFMEAAITRFKSVEYLRIIKDKL